MSSTELRTYETISLTKIDMPDDKFAALVERCKAAVTNEGKGEWLSSDDWGKAKISYVIGKEARAKWNYFRFKSTGAGVDEVRRALSINEYVLRQMTARTKDDGSDYESLKASIAQDIADRDRAREWREERPRREFRGPRREFGGGGGGYDRGPGGYGAPGADQGSNDDSGSDEQA